MYRGQIGLKVKIPQSGSVLEHIVYLCRYLNLVLMDATYKTCKLSLPLFFLVVRTNVGYAVIAEFIVQHEDTTSITKAMSIL